MLVSSRAVALPTISSLAMQSYTALTEPDGQNQNYQQHFTGP